MNCKNVFLITYEFGFHSQLITQSISRCRTKGCRVSRPFVIHYPMEHGVITNWNDMELIWQYLYGKDMLQTFPEEHPVLLTEPALNPMRNRERASEFFFETFNVPALFISMQAVLSLYSTVEVLLFNFRFLPRISTAMVD
ncbi:hypothetical protein M514_16001 [Trichuris suis]|uniref:Actin n=1 Tax=Trichuris suis TaxID=68888 RepID=A0A085NQZ5_9BILA|nr:hypothetical protein M514_16001 [Trichuris suis]